MSVLFRDLKSAWRSIRRSPGTSLIIVLTLTLGLGANVAIFSVINGVLLRPLPYPHPEKLVLVSSQFPTMGFDRFWVSPPEYFELREWNTSFEEIGGYRANEVSVIGTEQPLRVRGCYATATLFQTLGVAPQMGRTFSAEEDLPDGPSVAVLSYELWKSLGGDPDVVDSTLTIQGEPVTVVGVMPPGFDVEENHVEIWLPVQMDPVDRTARRGNHFLNLVARLRDGATLQSARAEMTALVASWRERSGHGHAPRPDGHPMRIDPLREEIVGGVRPALLALFGSVGFVLLIACANVANVMLARSEARRKELAVRSSMGASRWRLVRMMLTESLALALLGGVLGVAAGELGLRLLLGLSPGGVPRSGEVVLDTRVLLFALTASLLTGVLFGVLPALQLRIGGLASLLKEGAQRASSGVAGLASRRVLVVVEMALAVGLVVGSGLMLRSLERLLHVDKGFVSEGLVTFEVALPEASYPDATAQRTFFDRLFERLSRIPQVQSVAAASGLPPVRDVDANDMEVEGVGHGEDDPIQNADYWQFVTRDYLDTMQSRLVEGRGFELSDDADSAPVALVNQRFTEVFYGGESAVGRRIRPGWNGPNNEPFPWFTVVGVVEDVKQGGLAEATGTEVYWSFEQVGAILGRIPRGMHVVVRARTQGGHQGVEALESALRSGVWELDRTLPVAGLRTMDQVVLGSLEHSRFVTFLLTVFGGLALLLAAIGIYGVMSYAVSARGRELAIRVARGAARPTILGGVLRQGMVVAVFGLALGVVATLGLSRFLRSLLFEVEASDPSTYVAVLLLLAAVALVACLVPALRATRVDPNEVLRSE